MAHHICDLRLARAAGGFVAEIIPRWDSAFKARATIDIRVASVDSAFITVGSAGDSNMSSERIARHVPVTSIKSVLWLIITGSFADASTHIFPACGFLARTTATVGRRDMICHCFPRWCSFSRVNRVSSAFRSAGKAHER